MDQQDQRDLVRTSLDMCIYLCGSARFCTSLDMCIYLCGSARSCTSLDMCIYLCGSARSCTSYIVRLVHRYGFIYVDQRDLAHR